MRKKREEREGVIEKRRKARDRENGGKRREEVNDKGERER